MTLQEQKEQEDVLTCDYLVVGAGTSNLSFVDTLLNEMPSATFIIVDRFSRAGGHWTTAYPFVRLHQASCSYGVNSRQLGKNLTKWGRAEKYDTDDRATGEEICDYYAKVIEQFKATKRVKVFFNSNYLWNEEKNIHQFTSKIESGEDGDQKLYNVQCLKVVQTESSVIVPSMRKIFFPVDESVSVVSVNDVPEKLKVSSSTTSESYRNYVVLGAGKTGTDAVLYLLENGIDQSDITWIMPRDPWYFNRRGMVSSSVPGTKYWADLKHLLINPSLRSSDMEECFLNWEKAGVMLRVDPKIMPERFLGAMIEPSELEKLRTIQNIVRLGRVTSISSEEIILERGTVNFSADDTLFVDCMADKFNGYFSFDQDFSIFNKDRIRLGPLPVTYNPSGSSTLLAYLEAHIADDDVKNNFIYFAKGDKNYHQCSTMELFFLNIYYQGKTFHDLAQYYPPAISFMLQSRTHIDAPLHHGGFLPFAWAFFGPLQVNKTMDEFLEKVEKGDYGMDVSIPGMMAVDKKMVAAALRDSPSKRKGLCCS